MALERWGEGGRGDGRRGYLIELAKVGLRVLHQNLHEALDIRFTHHAIAVDTGRLMEVKPADLQRLLIRRGRGVDKALENGGERAQVPLIVKLDGRGHERVRDLHVHRNGT